jgi:hypothetical protein
LRETLRASFVGELTIEKIGGDEPMSISRNRRLKEKKKERRTLFGELSKIPYQSHYEYQCDECGIKEQVPVSAIEMMGFMVDRDDSTLPTFACEHCEGTMIPVNHPWHQDQISETQVMFSGLFELGGLFDDSHCPCCGELYEAPQK